MYSIDEDRIEQNQGEIQLSDWLELSENRCARTNSHLVAAERIVTRERLTTFGLVPRHKEGFYKE